MWLIRHVLPTCLLALSLAAWSVTPAAGAGGPITLTHVHGLSYSADGARIMIPSHDGLAIHEKGRWSKAPGPAHDYMGFSATRDALYSSGHPAPGSGLTNPFGVIRSTDGGKTRKKLGLEGESDFHLLATSYGTNAVYVVNHKANSRMSRPGIYSTRNDGLTWTRATAKGLGSDLKSLAVHPSDPASLPPERPTGCTCRAIRERLSSGSSLGQRCLPRLSTWTANICGSVPTPAGRP